MLRKSISILLSLMMIFSVTGAQADTGIFQIAPDALVDNVVLVSSDADVTSDASVLSDVSDPLVTDYDLQPMADPQSIFSASFDLLTPDAAFNGQNGAYNYYGASFKFYADDGSVGNGHVARNSSHTSVTIVERSSGGNAVKLASMGTAEDSIYIGSNDMAQTVSSGDIVHFGFGFKTDDMNCEKAFTIKDAATGYLEKFLKFQMDGLITFHGVTVDSYTTGEWYDIDIYYETSTGIWHLFINGRYAERFLKSWTMTIINVYRLIWTAPSGQITTVYLDDFISDYATSSDLKKTDRYSAYESITFANSVLGTNAVDSSKLSFTNFSASGLVKFNPAGGKFGKASFDKAMNMCNDAGYYPASSDNFIDYKGYDNSLITKGAKLYYSTSLAIDDNTSNSVWIQGIFQSDTDSPKFIEVSSDGSTVKVLNNTVSGVTLSKNQWYKLELVITVGEDGVTNNTLDAYLNGEKLNGSALEFSLGSGIVAISSVDIIRTGSYLKTDTASPSDAGYVEGYTKYAANSIWADDIVAAIYPADKSVISPTFTFRNPNVTIYSDRVENVATMSVEQFKDGSYLSLPYSIIDAVGNEVTDTSVPAKGKIMVIKPVIGGNIYIPIYDIPYPADYTDPTVEIASPSDGSTFVYGFDQSVTVSADINTYRADNNEVTIYIDGDAVQTFTSAPYEYVWTIPEVSGSHTIYAEVTDHYGTYVKSGDVTVNIRINEPPTVTFDGIDAENSIYNGDELTFTLISEDVDSRVEKTELYLNNELYDTFNTASKQFNIDFTENGRYVLKAVAYDEHGKTGSAECVVNVLRKTTVDVASVDFEGYSTGKAFSNTETISNASFTGNALTFAGDRGRKEIATANGNNFLKTGVTAETFSGSSNPYVAAVYNATNAVVEYETDICFSRNDIKYTANFRGSSNTGGDIHMYSFRFDEEGNVMVQNGSTYVDIGDYSAGTWYRLKVRMDIPNHKLDFSLVNLADSNDKCEAVGYSLQNANYYKLMQIRIESDFTAEKPGYIGYDNMVMKYTANYPSISGFTDNNDTVGAVAPNADSLHCVMSEAVGEITKDDIILENEYGIVTVESVAVEGNEIIVTPKDGFVSSANYKITIKSTAPLANGNDFGFDTVAFFETAAASFDVIGGQFTSDSSGIVFTVDLMNTTSQNKSCTLVTTTYKGDILTNVFSKTVSISSSDKVSSDVIAPSDSYDSIKAFVIYDWADGVPLSAKSFIFSK